MSINLKAKETLIQVGDLKGTYRFVLATEIYGKLSAAKVIKEAALRSGISRGVMQACWDAAGEVIKAWATEGHSVAIPGLGTMRFGVRAKSVAAVADVATNLISARRVIFTPQRRHQGRVGKHLHQHHLLRPQRQGDQEGDLYRRRQRGGSRQQGRQPWRRQHPIGRRYSKWWRYSKRWRRWRISVASEQATLRNKQKRGRKRPLYCVC